MRDNYLVNLIVLLLRILAICYNVWVILIFSYDKFSNIINNNERLKNIDRMLKQKCIESLKRIRVMVKR